MYSGQYTQMLLYTLCYTKYCTVCTGSCLSQLVLQCDVTYLIRTYVIMISGITSDTHTR